MNDPTPRFQQYRDVPYYRQQSFFWLMWFLFSPVALVLLLTGEVYFERNHEVRAFGVANRVAAGLISLIWIYGLVAAFLPE